MPLSFLARRLPHHGLQRWITTFQSGRFLPKAHQYSILITSLLLLAILFWPPAPEWQSSHAQNQADERDTPDDVYLVPPSTLSFDSTANWQTFHLRSEQALIQLLIENNLTSNEITQITERIKADQSGGLGQHGEIVKLRSDDQGIITAIVIDTGLYQLLFIRQNDRSFLPAL